MTPRERQTQSAFAFLGGISQQPVVGGTVGMSTTREDIVGRGGEANLDMNVVRNTNAAPVRVKRAWLDATDAEASGCRRTSAPRAQDDIGSSAKPRGELRSTTISGEAAVVFVVDDDVSVRESLELLILSAGWQPETFASAEEFLARSPSDVPSCLVLDLGLPDLNGLDLQQRVGHRTEMPIVFITGCGDVPTTVKAMKAGAVEFLTKPFVDVVLLNAIAQAIERSQAVLAQDAELRVLRARHASLTPREREIMALVVSGLLNKQIAAELGISEITVKAHRGQLMRKMEADSLADLVRIAARLDIPLVPNT
jgi:FixJ family two-component response regulator